MVDRDQGCLWERWLAFTDIYSTIGTVARFQRGLRPGARRWREVIVFSQPVRSIMERRKFVTTLPTTTVREASELMARKQIGAVLVVEGERLLGIFSERDAVFRVIARGLDPAATTLGQVMTPDPKTIKPNNTFGYAMTLMHENRFRHLPVVDGGKPIGIVSARSALDPDLEEFVCEERRRKSFKEEAV
jgi:CBS domain-containing protein